MGELTVMASVPTSLEEAVSGEWLSAALGREVATAVPGPVISRVSTNASVLVHFVDGSSQTVWVKCYFGAGRSAMPAGVPEAAFYRDVSATTGMRTLVAHYTAIDPDTQANVIVTGDVLGQGARFIDSTFDYTPELAAQSLTQLAILHSSTLRRSDLAELGFLAPRFERYSMGQAVERIRFNFDGPIGAGVPTAVRDAERLVATHRVVAAEVSRCTAWSVIHGDPHVANLFLDADGRPSFIDWQLVQRGPALVDVGYHIASALSIADRRSAEVDLVDHYIAERARLGSPIPADTDVARELALGIVHGFQLWGITQKVDPSITSALLDRLGTAAADHEVFGRFGC